MEADPVNKLVFEILGARSKFYVKHANTYLPSLLVRTLYNVILRIARNFLETMENIKNILPYKFGPILMG